MARRLATNSSTGGTRGRVDVVDAGADALVVAVVAEDLEQLEAGAGVLDRDHVGVEGGDRVDDVAELAVAHVGVDLGFRARPGRREPEAGDRPVEIVGPVGVAQRQTLAQGRLVDLDDRDAGRVEIGDLVADREGDLAAGLGRGWSSRTKDQLRIVTGPVSMPLTGRSVRVWAKVAQRTVIGAGRATSPKMTGGRT